MTSHKKNIIVAVSGGGRSLANLVEVAATADPLFRIAGVISSSPSCRAVLLAKEAGLPLFVDDFSRQDEQFLKSLRDWCRDAEFICLTGFLKRFPILPGFEDRIINIHPAMLPAFGGPGMYGKRVHEAVIGAGVRESGATVHYIDSEYDSGRIIAQQRVPVWQDDTPQSLADRVFAAEKLLLPATLQGLCSGALPLADHEIYFHEG